MVDGSFGRRVQGFRARFDLWVQRELVGFTWAVVLCCGWERSWHAMRLGPCTLIPISEEGWEPSGVECGSG